MEEKVKNGLVLVAGAICGAICVAAIGFEIYVWCKYGNMPAGEVPTWVLIFLGR